MPSSRRASAPLGLWTSAEGFLVFLLLVSDSAVQPSELELDCLGDHRMAFCAALVSLRFPVRVIGADAVTKSFPEFWEQFGAFR